MARNQLLQESVLAARRALMQPGGAYARPGAFDERLRGPIESARRQLAESSADNLLLRRSLDLPPGASDDDILVAAQAAATAAADARGDAIGTNVRDALPPLARKVAGAGVLNPKVWEADLPEFIPPPEGGYDDAAYMAAVRAAVRQQRAMGDPLAPTLELIGAKLVYLRRKGGALVRASFVSLAGLVGCCVETARKAVRWFERCGLLDTLNVLNRTQEGEVRRRPNLYIVPETEQPPPPPPADVASSQPAPDPVRVQRGTIGDRLQRCAALLGLKARPWGLNATPAAVGYRKREGVPAPG